MIVRKAFLASFGMTGKSKRFSILLLLVFLLHFLLGVTAVAQETSISAVVLEVKGVIGVATTEYISDGLSYAREINAPSLIILLDTPGGSLDATFEIVRIIERSDIPVITFIYPQGATGWSAGVFILLSSHVAAMAPGTVIGSSQPRAFPGGEPIDDPKIINSLTQFLVERAGFHGRNETAAAEFVTENLNLGADQAKRFGVIEIKASTVESMMNLVDGREVEVFERGRVKLQTAGAKLVNFNPSIRSMVLGFISEPTLAYLLFTLGVWILIFGLATTGPTGEVIGGILLVLGLIGLGFTVDLLVLFLLLIGGIFIVVEMLQPGFQIFGPAGIVCLMLGSLLLLRLDPSQWLVSQEWYTFFFMVVVGVVAVMTGFAVFILYKLVRLPKQRIALKWVVGETGRAIDALKQGQEGYIQVGGEYWKAKANVPVEAGRIVTVVGKEGPILIVKPEEET